MLSSYEKKMYGVYVVGEDGCDLKTISVDRVSALIIQYDLPWNIVRVGESPSAVVV